MTITTGDLAGGGKKNPARFPGSFLNDEQKAPFSALNLVSKSANGAVDGSVKMLVLSEEINTHRTPYHVMSDGEVVGAVKLGNSFQMSKEEYEFMQPLHGLPKGEYNENAYGYRVYEYEPYEDRVKIPNTSGLIVSVEDFLPENIIDVVHIRKSADVEERIFACAVLVPGVTDLHGSIYNEEVVREAAYYFLEHYLIDDEHGIDVMHDGEIVTDAIRPIMSFVLDEEKTYKIDIPAIEDEEHPSKEMDSVTFPKGTWILYARIISDTLWNKVKDGTYTGWSIYGIARVRELRKILDEAA